MSVECAAEAIFEIAEQIERQGGKFYRAAAEKTTNEDVHGLLLRLADAEERHEDFFAYLRNEAPREATEPSEPGMQQEGRLYMHAVAASHMLGGDKDVSEVLTGKESVEDILNIAIEFEKDTIVFFLGMKENRPECSHSREIAELVREEMTHVADLRRQLEQLEWAEKVKTRTGF